MFLQQVDLTSALRPTLQPDESLLFVQDNVGLYEGYVFLAIRPILKSNPCSESIKFQIIKMVTSISRLIESAMWIMMNHVDVQSPST
jgi:hypothetical protein